MVTWHDETTDQTISAHGDAVVALMESLMEAQLGSREAFDALCVAVPQVLQFAREGLIEVSR